MLLCVEVYVMRTIPEKETLTIEFKSDRSGYSDADLVNEIVGMANTQDNKIRRTDYETGSQPEWVCNPRECC
jgi:hypothetical protein